ncbi:MAG: hypothetical protein HQK50_05305 [Oligoflexia bacterium]|nr:hypothetical protein [Oligoflexia bacterium]MBF0364966.1 hypothetical protein [Oligoflexia bacterium]
MEKQENSKSIINEKRVVVGMTGGIDSAVAAFLLKKQGYECIGVSIVMVNEEQIREGISKIAKVEEKDENSIFYKKKENEKAVSLEERVSFLNSCCSVKKLEHVRDVCETIGIAFYAVNATLEYRDLILESVIAARLSGESFIPCLDCNVLRMKILHEKAKVLGAYYVGSGHYAKVYKNDKLNCYHVFTANDEESDQSMLLANLEQEQLQNLLMPLADLRKIDVQKINERYGLGGRVLRDSTVFCFNSVDISYFVEAQSHHGLRPTGHIMDYNTDSIYGEHLGIHKHWIGQTQVVAKDGIGAQEINPEYVVMDIDPKGRVLVGDPSTFVFEGCAVDSLRLAPFIDLTKPLELFLKKDLKSKKVRATVYFKTAGVALLMFSEKIYGLSIGHLLVFYDKDGASAKVMGSGRVSFLGSLSPVNRTDIFDTVKRAQKKREAKEDSDGVQIKVSSKSAGMSL